MGYFPGNGFVYTDKKEHRFLLIRVPLLSVYTKFLVKDMESN